MATPTEVPSTATPEPTEEPTEEPTLEPSPVSTETEALPVDQPVSDESSESLPEGFNAWCLKRGVYDQGTVAADGAMPSWGQPAVMKNGKPDLVIEVQSCTFVYTFDQPVEPGTKLVIHDTLDAPFVDEELIPTENNPNMAYAVVSNATLVEAQVWTIDFRAFAWWKTRLGTKSARKRSPSNEAGARSPVMAVSGRTRLPGCALTWEKLTRGTRGTSTAFTAVTMKA